MGQRINQRRIKSIGPYDPVELALINNRKNNNNNNRANEV